MQWPMFAANITAACFATHACLFAPLSCVCEAQFWIRRHPLRHANLAVLRTLTEFHSRTAGLPLVRLRLSFDPSVWMSHTPGQVVQPEEALFAVARYPILLPHVGRSIARLVVRLRIFPVTTDAGIHQCYSKIHLETISPHVLVHIPLPFVVVVSRTCSRLSYVRRDHMHRVNDSVETPIEYSQVETI